MSLKSTTEPNTSVNSLDSTSISPDSPQPLIICPWVDNGNTDVELYTEYTPNSKEDLIGDGLVQGLVSPHSTAAKAWLEAFRYKTLFPRINTPNIMFVEDIQPTTRSNDLYTRKLITYSDKIKVLLEEKQGLEKRLDNKKINFDIKKLLEKKLNKTNKSLSNLTDYFLYFLELKQKTNKTKDEEKPIELFNKDFLKQIKELSKSSKQIITPRVAETGTQGMINLTVTGTALIDYKMTIQLGLYDGENAINNRVDNKFVITINIDDTGTEIINKLNNTFSSLSDEALFEVTDSVPGSGTMTLSWKELGKHVNDYYIEFSYTDLSDVPLTINKGNIINPIYVGATGNSELDLTLLEEGLSGKKRHITLVGLDDYDNVSGTVLLNKYNLNNCNEPGLQFSARTVSNTTGLGDSALSFIEDVQGYPIIPKVDIKENIISISKRSIGGSNKYPAWKMAIDNMMTACVQLTTGTDLSLIQTVSNTDTSTGSPYACSYNRNVFKPINTNLPSDGTWSYEQTLELRDIGVGWLGVDYFEPSVVFTGNVGSLNTSDSSLYYEEHLYTDIFIKSEFFNATKNYLRGKIFSTQTSTPKKSNIITKSEVEEKVVRAKYNELRDKNVLDGDPTSEGYAVFDQSIVVEITDGVVEVSFSVVFYKMVKEVTINYKVEF